MNLIIIKINYELFSKIKLYSSKIFKNLNKDNIGVFKDGEINFFNNNCFIK